MSVLSILGKFRKINFKDSSKDLKECDILLFCHDVDRPLTLDKVAYSPLIDTLRETLESHGFHCQSIAHPYSSLVGGRACNNVIAINRSYLLSRIANRLSSFSDDLPLGVQSNIYCSILERTKAKLVVTIGASDDLCQACHLLDRFHVELLHGIGYTEPQWGWEKKHKSKLPKGILSLDEVSTKGFYPLLEKGVVIKTIPHPFLSRFTPKNRHSLPKEWLFSEQQSKNFKKSILVSLQWAYAGDHGDHVQFSNILSNGLFFPEIEALVEKHKDVFWHFRFHPVHLRSRIYKPLIEFMNHFVSRYSNCDWKDASRLPYPSVVMQCAGNIGMSSMSCYDAAAMGVPSLMLCPTIQHGKIHEDWFSDLVEEGYVKKATPHFKTIEDWVTEVEQLPPRLTNLEDHTAWDSAYQWLLEESGLKSKVETHDR